MGEWKFPGGYGITVTGVNDSGIMNFDKEESVVRPIVREVIQNSMDAKRMEESAGDGAAYAQEPVRIEMGTIPIPQESIPGIKKLREEVIPKAKAFWKDKSESILDFIAQYERAITPCQDRKEVLALYFRDFNTTGLKDRNFQSLINMEGVSEKNSDLSGGSKGIGKAAPFLKSRLRMVLYSSLAKEDSGELIRRRAGILKFVSFGGEQLDRIVIKNGIEEKEQYVTQSKGILETGASEHLFEAELPRDELGTDIYVMDLEGGRQNFFQEAKQALLIDFLVALYEGKLIVTINKEEFSQATLPQHMEWLAERLESKAVKKDERKIVKDTLCFYTVLCGVDSGKSRKFHLPEKLVKEFPMILDSPEDAYLVIGSAEDAPRTVLQTRDMGMRICERKKISGQYSFAGVFHAQGLKLNAFLKSIENVNHDTWSAERLLAEDLLRRNVVLRKTGEEFLGRLFDWYKASVIEMFQTEAPEEVNAFGMEDLFPMSSMKEQKAKEHIDKSQEKNKRRGGLRKKIRNVNVNEKGEVPVNHEFEEEQEEKINQRVMRQAFAEDGENDLEDLVPIPDKKCKENNLVPNEVKPDKKNLVSSETGDKKVLEEKRVEIANVKIRLKFIEIEPGIYRVFLMSPKSYSKIVIELSLLGENGKAYGKSINQIQSETPGVIATKGLKENEIVIESIHANEPISILATMRNTYRCCLKGKMYEVRR